MRMSVLPQIRSWVTLLAVMCLYLLLVRRAPAPSPAAPQTQKQNQPEIKISSAADRWIQVKWTASSPHGGSASTAPAPAPDYSRVPYDWTLALSSNGFPVVQLETLYSEIREEYAQSSPVYPERRNLFRALHLTPADEVRV